MFSRVSGADSVQRCEKCNQKCADHLASDDELSSNVQKRIEELTGRPEQATGRLASDGAPQLIPKEDDPCRQTAWTLGQDLRRFNRYREALPYARAAYDLNDRGGETENDKDEAVKVDCIVRLPTKASELCAELGLPPETIKDEDLRNEETGFRAVLYRDASTGKVILVGRDTQPTSLVDWQTNTRNGEGKATDQYQAMADLSRRLHQAGVEYNIAGYSKGGGLAQEAGLRNPNAQVFVFNSAGLHEKSFERAGITDVSSLSRRTRSFSAENDFLTYMNNTTDPQQQIDNAKFLLKELKGENRIIIDPMEIDHVSPKNNKKIEKDSNEQKLRDSYFSELDAMIKNMETKKANGIKFQSFPPVRADHKEVVGATQKPVEPGISLSKLIQHQMKKVLNPMEDSVKSDRKNLEKFIKKCT